MGTVVVRKFGGDEIGRITQSVSGDIVIEATTDEIRVQLLTIIERLRQQPLVLRSGVEIVEGDEVIHSTVITECQPGNRLYLRALADALLAPENRVDGKRIRGVFVEN